MIGPRFWMNDSYRLVKAPPPPTPPGKKKETKKSKKQKKFSRIKGTYESPKKKSKKETISRKGLTMHCSKCGEAGHNAAGCRKFPKNKKQKVGDTSSQIQIGDSSLKHKSHSHSRILLKPAPLRIGLVLEF